MALKTLENERLKKDEQTEQLMTQEELAFRWQISEATIERDRSLRRGCRYMKLGGLIRYRLQDVLDYESGCTVETKGKGQNRGRGT
jgi:hypothetical protein